MLFGFDFKILWLLFIDYIVVVFSWFVMVYVWLMVCFWVIGLVFVVMIVGGVLMLVWVYLFKLEYLFEGNWNLVFGLLILLLGYNFDIMEMIVECIENVVWFLWEVCFVIVMEDGKFVVNSFFFVVMLGNSFVGVVVVDGSWVVELILLLFWLIFVELGIFGFMI